MKALSKLCLNSFGGRIGQRASLDNYDLISNHNKFLRLITNDEINAKAIHIINSDCVELRYNHDTDYDIETEFGSEQLLLLQPHMLELD